MKITEGTNLMNLPKYASLGLEIEIQNVDEQKLQQLIDSNPLLKGWKLTKDASVTDNGVEIVSPPLNEKKNPQMYDALDSVLKYAKMCPKNPSKEVYVDKECGGHIHMDATKMRENFEMMECYMRLWAESEELIYKMCNEKNDVIREGAMSFRTIDVLKDIAIKNFEDLKLMRKIIKEEGLKSIGHLPKATIKGVKKGWGNFERFTNSIFHGKGFAHPIGAEIKKSEKHGDVVRGSKDSILGLGRRYTYAKNLSIMAMHETGLNLQHIATNKRTRNYLNGFAKAKDWKDGLMGKEINTYEHRNHNSTLNLSTWKENMLFDAALQKVAYEWSKNPDEIGKNLSSFFDKDIDEKEKATRFMDLLFDDEKTKQVYMERWESVKDEPIYKKTKGFANTFKKQSLEKTAKSVKSKEVFLGMKEFFADAKFMFNKDKVLENGVDRDAR